MARRSVFDTPTVPRLYQVLEEVRNGLLIIPDFQRPFVWDDERRLLLLDSVAKGMPIGSFLIWRTREHPLRTYEKLGPFKLPGSPKKGELGTYLLDGHQRMTTLFAALNWAEDEAHSERVESEDVRWPIYFDLERNEFKLLARGRSTPPLTWLPLSILLHPRRLYAFQKKLVDRNLDALVDRAEALASDFKDYQVPLVPLISEDLELVTDAFVRVNSQGKAMHETYMVQALAYSTYDVRSRLDLLRQRLAHLGWARLDDQILLNALKVSFKLDVYGAGPRELHAKLQESGYEESFDRLEENIVHAVRFLSSLGVRGKEALPYAYQLIALAETAREVGGSLRGEYMEKLQHWFWATTYTGYFNGMSANRIREAITHVVHLAQGRGPRYPSDMPREVTSLGRYYFQATRTRAFVLLLLRAAHDEETEEWLGQAGAQAVDKILPEVDSAEPANRVVITPRELGRLRLALQPPTSQGDLFVHLAVPTDDERQRLFERHMIPDAAAERLWRGDVEGFLELRREALTNLERQMVEDDLGLEFREEP